MFPTRRLDPIAHRLESFGLSRTAADRLSRRGTFHRLPAGTVLCREGERGLEAFLLLEGVAEVQLTDTTVRIGPGDVVGELATLDPRRTRNATVVAASDVTLLVYDARTFCSLADDEELRGHLRPERAAA